MGKLWARVCAGLKAHAEVVAAITIIGVSTFTLGSRSAEVSALGDWRIEHKQQHTAETAAEKQDLEGMRKSMDALGQKVEALQGPVAALNALLPRLENDLREVRVQLSGLQRPLPRAASVPSEAPVGYVP